MKEFFEYFHSMAWYWEVFYCAVFIASLGELKGIIYYRKKE
jgi:hypothetical protein